MQETILISFTETVVFQNVQNNFIEMISCCVTAYYTTLQDFQVLLCSKSYAVRLMKIKTN